MPVVSTTPLRAGSPGMEFELLSSVSSSSSCCSVSPMDGSDDLSPSRLGKYRTPPSPILGEGDTDVVFGCSASDGHFTNNQDDYLLFLEPFPVSAPPYSLLAPGGCPRFPIEVPAAGPTESLPAYLPSIYKIGLLSRKIEWLSPFEPSPSRLWKLIVVELNSTQLNFYYVPPGMEAHLASVQSASLLSEGSLNALECSDVQNMRSGFTTTSDLLFYKSCLRLGILDSLGPCTLSSASSIFDEDQSPIRSKGLKKCARLIRSFSLQHARVGLASDYLKKPNVLRIRVESEQILLHFGSTKELVEWHFSLSMGRDLSLDLEDRQVPRYRTVPRRRTAASNSVSHAALSANHASRLSSLSSRYDNIGQYYEDPVRGRSRSNSQRSMESSAMRSRFTTMASKFRSRTLSNSFTPVEVGKVSRTSEFSLGSESPREPQFSNALELVRVPSTENDDNELIDGRNMSDLQGTDDEDDEEDEIELNGNRGNLACAKWAPVSDRTDSERKFYRNCLRCIKPLNHDDLWVNKPMVKPSSLSPLNLSFLKNVKYAASTSTSSSNLSLVSLSSSFSAALLVQAPIQTRKKSFSFKDSFMTFSDGGLSKIPNHYVKEFTVGTTGLIAKEI